MAASESGDFDLLLRQQEDPLQTRPVSLRGGDAAAHHTQKRKKIKSAELEEMHAASQRLLRETPNASFKSQILIGKSITSVLEKIRLRKKQLVQGRRSAFSILQPDGSVSLKTLNEELTSFATQAQDLIEVEVMDTQANKRPCVRIEKSFSKNANKNLGDGVKVASISEGNPEEDETDVDVVRPSNGFASEYRSDDVEKHGYLESGNAFRAPMEDTQDLLSSPESSENDNNEDTNPDTEDEVFGGSGVNLHLDTETQDDFEEWLDEDANKENLEPTFSDKSFSLQILKGQSVKALIDDEAEDEDEDVLVPGEDDEGDEGEDLADMVVEEANEEARDKEKRAELHRRWLEQQDAVMTDDILLRLKTGWRPRESRKRGLEFLDGEVEVFSQKEGDIKEGFYEDPELQENQESPDDGSQDVEALTVDINLDESRAFKSLEDLNDKHESSDDEEAEQRMMRQRFLQESEEQREFMSPADDETSREIFGLINKVNIASSNKKLKHASGKELKNLRGGTSNSSSSFGSKSSFLRRSASSALGSVPRPGSSSGSGTRSFIFGRDDSNSSHSFDRNVSLGENKENLEPTAQGLIQEFPQIKHPGQGKDNSKASKSSTMRLGPSLFEILRRQSSDLDHSLKTNSFKEDSLPISPILTAFKHINPTNTPRGRA